MEDARARAKVKVSLFPLQRTSLTLLLSQNSHLKPPSSSSSSSSSLVFVVCPKTHPIPTSHINPLFLKKKKKNSMIYIIDIKYHECVYFVKHKRIIQNVVSQFYMITWLSYCPLIIVFKFTTVFFITIFFLKSVLHFSWAHTCALRLGSNKHLRLSVPHASTNTINNNYS